MVRVEVLVIVFLEPRMGDEHHIPAALSRDSEHTSQIILCYERYKNKRIKCDLKVNKHEDENSLLIIYNI